MSTFNMTEFNDERNPSITATDEIHISRTKIKENH